MLALKVYGKVGTNLYFLKKVSTMIDSVIPKNPSELDLSDLDKKRLLALEEYDLSEITNNFTDDSHQEGRIFAKEQIYPIKLHFGKADLEIAKMLELEFKRFVALTIIFPKETQAPSGPVDMYWHFFILHTAKYREFCQAIWYGNEPNVL